jgi:DNA uptake protein ComE-like DNA-binding protein
MRDIKPRLFTIVIAIFALVSVTRAADVVLDANTATAEEMSTLPHMDDVLAGVVVSKRPFVNIGELNHLLSSDLDDDQLEGLYGRLFVSISLNDAKRSDILLIPGVGTRMAHEFEEYRPYSNMEQFRREMGKYVDEQEVARLEQYVTLD